MFKQKNIDWVLALLFLTLTFVFGNFVKQSEFSIPLYIGWFALYIWIVFKQANQNNLLFYLIIACIARASLIPIFPLLSDDIYRFIWDGRLILNGENPFHFLPSTIIEDGLSYSGLTPKLFAELNSPNYYTIYPPVCQAIFTISEFVSGSSLNLSSAIMKIAIVAFEIGTVYNLFHILKKLDLPKTGALLYALNPLIIIEISGNLHFEGAMIFFLSCAILMILHKKWIRSALFFSLSVASKLLPLMFLPILFRYYGWKKGLKYCLLVGLFSILLFSPLLNLTFFENFANSLDLYFQKFEFNASIYFIGRYIGQQIIGYNIIQVLGPALALTSVTLILIIAFWRKNYTPTQLLSGMLFTFCVYLFFGTTIHPWYLSIPIFLSCFTTYRFTIAWSLLIMFTYINYAGGSYAENLGVVALEYILVFGIMFYELFFVTVRTKLKH